MISGIKRKLGIAPTFNWGHYHSPLVTRKEVCTDIFSKEEWPAGIERMSDEVLNLAEKIIKPVSYKYHQARDLDNYRYPNDFFPVSDALVLLGMMFRFEPKKVIEVGSGYSTAVMLDHPLPCKITCVEPNPERLEKLIGKDRVDILKCRAEVLPTSWFTHLEANDILFIDSSHVLKTNSDVHYILFDILPKLKSGVLIHFHDIFYPFEYPKDWVMEKINGFGWNEAYALRAFLTGNKDFEIIYWQDYQQRFHDVNRYMPQANGHKGGSFWLRKR